MIQFKFTGTFSGNFKIHSLYHRKELLKFTIWFDIRNHTRFTIQNAYLVPNIRVTSMNYNDLIWTNLLKFISGRFFKFHLIQIKVCLWLINIIFLLAKLDKIGSMELYGKIVLEWYPMWHCNDFFCSVGQDLVEEF